MQDLYSIFNLDVLFWFNGILRGCKMLEIIRETLQIERDGEYVIKGIKKKLKLNPKERREAIYISHQQANEIRKNAAYDGPFVMGNCGYRMSQKDSFDAAYDMINEFRFKDDEEGKVLVINFANPYNPGGGVKRGAKAQEEDLCRKSTLLVSLESKGAKPYYDAHNSNFSELSSDAMIISPNVEIFRDSKGKLLEDSYVVSVLTCAAPIVRHEVRSLGKDAYEELLYNRILCMLHVAVEYGYKYLVLGAWGCGAFGNDAKVVAKLFYKALKNIRCNRRCENSLFSIIHFAIYSNSEDMYNFDAFNEYFEDFYKDEKDDEIKKIEQAKKDKEKNFDKILGCMMGGAIGDALGYPVEFMTYDKILDNYGCKGITQFDLDDNGTALISDDTQMTLFTANGILSAETRGCLRGIMGPIENYIFNSYLDWLYTQDTSKKPPNRFSWLLDIEELYARRAPGNTCLSVLNAEKPGEIKSPINDSKGCGGIMRVAPIALYFECDDSYYDKLAIEGAKVAALTHGHPLGYMPSAVLVYILNRLAFSNDCDLKAVIEDSIEMLLRIFYATDHLDELINLMELAINLSENDASDIDNIKSLGEGWVAEETLAIALYCSLRYKNDFSKGIIAAVNHSGDSDSTGAVTGNILGALLGFDKIDGKWKKNLELYDVIKEISLDLCHGCWMSEYGSYRDEDWVEKYVEHRKVMGEEYL